MAPPADNEARARLLKVLDDAKTFDELTQAVNAVKGSHPLFGCARGFLSDGDPTGLDAELQERFAQVLSRFVESRRALELAGVLEHG